MINIKNAKTFAGDAELLRLACAFSARCHELDKIFVISAENGFGDMSALYDIHSHPRVVAAIENLTVSEVLS